jgi:hypothetical protein
MCVSSTKSWTDVSSQGRYVVDAVLLGGRSAGEVAKTHGISRYWLDQLTDRRSEANRMRHGNANLRGAFPPVRTARSDGARVPLLGRMPDAQRSR